MKSYVTILMPFVYAIPVTLSVLNEHDLPVGLQSGMGHPSQNVFLCGVAKMLSRG
jgi:hypothetical protein